MRESVQRFQLAALGANDGLWDAELKGKHWTDPTVEIWYSPRFKELLGFGDDEFPNVLASWQLRLHPEDREQVFAALAEHIDHRQPYDVEYRLRMKSGEYRWFSARGQAIWDDQGKLLRMSGSFRDTDRIREDATKLEQSEARWRSLVENAPDIIVLTDLDGTIRFINRDTQIAQESIGRTTYDYIDPQQKLVMKQAYEALQKTGQSQKFEVYGQTETGGEMVWYASSLGAIWQNGRIASAVLISTDITDRKKAEIRLKESEARWRSLVENAPDIIILTDPDGILQSINRDTEEARRAIGKTVYDYIREPFWDQTRTALAAIRKTGQPQQFELRAHQQGGGTAWYTTRFGPIFHEHRLQSVIIVATDITHRKLAEERLEREREWLRRLLELQERERQLVAYEIHDGLVQYLTGGIMHMEAAGFQATTEDARSQAEYDRGMSLLRDSLAEARRLISGLRPPILDEQGVVAAPEYLVNEARPEIPDIKFVNRFHFGRLAAPLEVAIFRITQEALSNIRQHSGAKRALIELVQHGEWVRLSIRDWGCGFDPGRVHEERFGLQGIRQRARLLGTVASIESAPGKGASIVVDFPLVSEPTAKEH